MGFTLREKLLAQSRPANTSAAEIYAPPAGMWSIIKSIIICNTSSADTTFSIYAPKDGATLDEDSALWFEQVIAAKQTIDWSTYFPLSEEDALAVQSGTADALTFTVGGAEVSET
jgi:hypothetical protein